MSKKYPHQLVKRSSIAVVLLAGLLTGCGEKTMEAYIDDARAYAENQRLDAAIVEYKNAIQVQPDAALPRFELGKLYLLQGNYVSAEKELNRALELGYSASEVIPLLSNAYQQSGAENALVDIDHRAEGMTAVESVEVGFYKLQALVQLGQTEDAKTLLNDLVTIDTSSVYKGLVDSYVFIIARNYSAALDMTKQLKAQAPSNKDVLLQLAGLYLQQGDTSEAVGVYEEYVSIYPSDLNRKFVLASLLVESRELEKAEPIVDELMAINGSNPLLNTYKGIIEASNENFASALQYLETAIQNGRSDEVVRLVAGFSAFQIRDFEAAQRHLTMVASNLPDNHPGLRMLAESLLQQGENDEALDVLNRVEMTMDADASLFSKAGYQLLRQGNVVGAQQMVEKTNTANLSGEDLARLGVLQLSLNDIDGLINIQEAVKQAPESATSQNTLVRALLATGKLDEAREASESWRQAQPNDVKPVIYLANIAVVEKDFDTAESLLVEAETLDATNPEITYTRAKKLIAQERVSDAATLLQTYVASNPSDTQAITMWYAAEAAQDNGPMVVQHTRRLLEADSSNIDLRVLLARLYSFSGEFEATERVLSDVEADGTTPMGYWNLLGQSYVRQNKVDEAAAHFSQWIDVYPQDKNAVLGMLLVHDTKRDYQDGLTLVDQVLEKRPEPQLSLLKAYFHSMLGQSEPAWSVINGYSEQVKALPFVRSIIARLYMVDGKPEDALEHAKAAYESNSSASNALLRLASLEATGAGDDAYTFLTDHVAQNEGDLRIAMLLAERQIARDTDKAVSTYESLLTQMPDNFVVLNNLAYINLEANSLDKAEELARKAVSIQPRNSDAVDTLAQVLVAKGEQEEALTLYDQIATQPIPNEEVYLNHVELLFKMGRATQAKRRLDSREFVQPSSKERIESLKASFGF